MNKNLKIISCVMALSVFCSVAGTMAGCGKSDKIQLFFDGGGGSGNYTTTRDYSTLQTLADEWNDKNDKYEVIINKASLNGNRGQITSMLSAGTAPDMLMQVGSVVNDDIGNNWYVELDSYLEKPNPYEEGNKAWKDIYGSRNISATKAGNGKNYYVCLDNIAIGMMYNMDILKQAGITKVPETYSEFLNCLETLQKAKEKGTIEADVYSHGGLWQENYIGTSVYGNKVELFDEDKSGIVSTYELIKAYKEGKWNLSSPEFREFLRLCYAKAKYYPDNYLGYDVNFKFAKGKLAITDAVGNTMNTLAKNARFEVAISGYPILDKEASEFGGKKVIRGSAGLSSAYWITNSAINKGQEAIDECIDFLMYITATKNNERLVNDLGYALPIDVSKSNNEIFNGLREQYTSDLNDKDALLWSACFIPSQLDSDFDQYYQLAMGDFYEDSENVKTGDIDAVINTLSGKIDGSIKNICDKYGWDFS